MNRLAIFTFIFLAALVSGCASPVKPTAMAPLDYKPEKIQPFSVSVAVDDGQKASAFQVSNESLQKAIEETILKTHAFKQLLKGKDADYELSATVVTLSQPVLGFSMTVKIDIAWTLKKLSDDTLVWRKLINSVHTAGAGRAFVSTVRLRMATESAVKNNIESALREIAALEL